jgi:RNA binding exosome subunit
MKKLKKSEKSKKVNFVLTAAEIDKLAYIMEHMDTTNQSDAIKLAIKLTHYFISETEEGGKHLFIRDDKNPEIEQALKLIF